MTGWRAFGLAAAVLLVGCGDAEPVVPRLIGAPSTAAYVAAQAADLPEGMARCDYSGPLADFATHVNRPSPVDRSVEQSWRQQQAAGAIDSYLAVYADTPRICTMWRSGTLFTSAHRSSRAVATFVARFTDSASAQAAYQAGVHGPWTMDARPGPRVLSGAATGLGPNASIRADETTIPTVHHAVWQSGPFHVYFESQELTRGEFQDVISAENRRAQ